MNTIYKVIEVIKRDWSNRSTKLLGEDIYKTNTQRAYWDYRTCMIRQDEALTWAEKLKKLSSELCEMTYIDAFDNVKFMSEILNFQMRKVDFDEIAQALLEEHEYQLEKYPSVCNEMIN